MLPVAGTGFRAGAISETIGLVPAAPVKYFSLDNMSYVAEHVRPQLKSRAC
jgi:hypothetical protein